MSVLDNPVWWSLTGPQQDLGTSTPLAARFDPAVSPFGAFDGPPTAAHWDELASIVGAGGQVAVITDVESPYGPGVGWTAVWEAPGVQMVGDQVDPAGSLAAQRPNQRFPTAVPEPLGAGDVPDMLALVAEARPGPFLLRTVEFGGYRGVRRDGRLVAMAGERLRPPGYAEISAVATDSAHRRQGLGELLVRAVVAGILERSEIPFLHAAESNLMAIRLYEAMGFTVRRRLGFLVVQAPGGASPEG